MIIPGDVTWSAAEIVTLLTELGVEATKVLVLLINEHQGGRRHDIHCNRCCRNLWSQYLEGKSEQVRLDAAIQDEEEFLKILRTLESRGHFSIIWDSVGRDHIFQFVKPTREEMQQNHDRGVAEREEEEARPGKLGSQPDQRAKESRFRAANPELFCMALTRSGGACPSRRTTLDGLCNFHRLMVAPRSSKSVRSTDQGLQWKSLEEAQVQPG